MKCLLFASCLMVLLAVVYCQSVSEKQCNMLNTSCSSCIAGPTDSAGNATKKISIQCYYCPNPTNVSASKCRHFDTNAAFPINGLSCPDLKYNVLTCALNALTIVILIAVACVLFLFVVVVCCCCCCCCLAKRRKRVKMVEEARYREEKDNIKQRSNERRTERKAKHDEIRRKYGLYQDDTSEGTYKRLD